MEIRRAQLLDVPELTDLYNHYVVNTPITFDLETKTIAEREGWFEQFATQGRYQLFVAIDQGKVMGYACSHRFREKAAYQTSVESTIYLHPEAAGRKLGTHLYEVLFQALQDEDVHRIFAGVTVPNDASVALHQKLGFHQIGLFSEVGFKFGEYWDVAWFEKPL